MVLCLFPHPASPLLLRHLPRLLPPLLTPPISPTGSELRSQGPEPLPQQQPQSPDPKPKPNETCVSACGTPAPTPCSPLPTSISLPSSPTSRLGPSHFPVGVRITHTRVCANSLSGQDYISHEALLWESRRGTLAVGPAGTCSCLAKAPILHLRDPAAGGAVRGWCLPDTTSPSTGVLHGAQGRPELGFTL